MSTRKVKDAKDLSTNELIYFKSHAKATYMSNGTTVEDAINSIGSGGNGVVEAVNSITIDGISLSPTEGVVNLGYLHKQLSTSTASSMTILPNVYYRNTNTTLSSLTVSLATAPNINILNEYFVEFTTRSAGTTISFPSSVKWANGIQPTFEPGYTYQVSIVNNLGTCIKFA